MLLDAIERPLAVVEHFVPAGAMTPLHVHREDEAVRVLEGRVAVHLPDEVVRLEPGDGLVVPAGTPHALVAGEEIARLLSGARTPSAARYEDFLLAVAHPGTSTPDEAAALAVIAAATGTEVLGPPGVLP